MIDRLRRLFLPKSGPEPDSQPQRRDRPLLVVLQGGLAEDMIRLRVIQGRGSESDPSSDSWRRARLRVLTGNEGAPVRRDDRRRRRVKAALGSKPRWPGGDTA